ncbi:hypothetical protein MBLNU230_g3942t1 [Neophaeotheca triangularis]
MSNNQQRQTEATRTENFIREASKVQDPDHKLWAPARWLIMMVQWMIAIIIVTIAKGFAAIFTKQKGGQTVRTHKITGSAYSTNVIVPDTDFSLVSGSPKTIAKKADSGNDITSHFCGDCGTTLFRDGPSFPGAKIVKAGVLDDGQALEEARPAVELYAAQRVGWAKGVEGAAQLKGMPGSEAVA